MKIASPTESQERRLLQLADDEPGTRVVGRVACPVLRMEDDTIRYVAPNGNVNVLGRINRKELRNAKGEPS